MLKRLEVREVIAENENMLFELKGMDAYYDHSDEELQITHEITESFEYNTSDDDDDSNEFQHIDKMDTIKEMVDE